MDKVTLKTHGLKSTTPRVKILELFEQSEKRHFTVDDIHSALDNSGDDIAIATIYRVLAQFEKAGIIIRHSFEDDRAVFELNDGDHHDHLVCTQCGKVVEFVDDTIEERQQRVAQQAGFTIIDHSLNIFGICPDCQ